MYQKKRIKLGFRHRYLVSKYGITLEQYEKMLVLQNNRCAICLTTNPRGSNVLNTEPMSFAVDHNHITNENRGLLCNLCNRALGFLQDDPIVVKRAHDYLLKYEILNKEQNG